MKIILRSFYLIILTISFLSCAAQNNLEILNTVEYKAHTRGNNETVKVIGKTLSYKSVNEEKIVDLREEQIKAINEVVFGMNLSKISDLKAPSDKRYSDGAMIASFIITKDKVDYKSSEFDHGNPPKELKTLYELLYKYIK